MACGLQGEEVGSKCAFRHESFGLDKSVHISIEYVRSSIPTVSSKVCVPISSGLSSLRASFKQKRYASDPYIAKCFSACHN
jgi:hypothetical protein